MAIKKVAGVFVVLFLLVNSIAAQENLPFTPGSAKGKNEVRELWIAPAVGLSPKFNSIRLSVISGNLFLNRAGGYVTIEKGLDSSYFTNIYGVTVTVSRHIYVWGGMDLFTPRGAFNSFKRARKEMGVGIMPWRDLTVNAGWSKAVGLTFSLGLKLPLAE